MARVAGSGQLVWMSHASKMHTALTTQTKGFDAGRVLSVTQATASAVAQGSDATIIRVHQGRRVSKLPCLQVTSVARVHGARLAMARIVRTLTNASWLGLATI